MGSNVGRELTPYLLSVPDTERLELQGLWVGRWQGLRTVAAMVGIITLSSAWLWTLVPLE